jgi:hypothetical protein
MSNLYMILLILIAFTNLTQIFYLNSKLGNRFIPILSLNQI